MVFWECPLCSVHGCRSCAGAHARWPTFSSDFRPAQDRIGRGAVQNVAL